jgi:putative phosphotransacetylase
VRSGDKHSLELHIDTDEANAAVIGNGDLLELIR